MTAKGRSTNKVMETIMKALSREITPSSQTTAPSIKVNRVVEEVSLATERMMTLPKTSWFIVRVIERQEARPKVKVARQSAMESLRVLETSKALSGTSKLGLSS